MTDTGDVFDEVVVHPKGLAFEAQSPLGVFVLFDLVDFCDKSGVHCQEMVVDVFCYSGNDVPTQVAHVIPCRFELKTSNVTGAVDILIHQLFGKRNIFLSGDRIGTKVQMLIMVILLYAIVGVEIRHVGLSILDIQVTNLALAKLDGVINAPGGYLWGMSCQPFLVIFQKMFIELLL